MVKIVTGDETGIIKVIDIRKKSLLTKCGEQSRQNGICSLTWVPSSIISQSNEHTSSSSASLSSSSHVAALTRCGNVEVWDTLTGTRVHRCRNAGENGVYLTTYLNKFITCSSKDGIVRVFNQDCTDADYSSTVSLSTTLTSNSNRKNKSKDTTSNHPSSSSSSSSVSSSSSSVAATGFSVLPFVDPTIEIKPTVITDMDGNEITIPLPPPSSLNTAKFHSQDHLLAVGGNEFDLNLWDISNQVCTWKADPLPNDNYDVRIPIWVRDITFLHDPSIITTLDSVITNSTKKKSTVHSSSAFIYPSSGRGDPSTVTSHLIATVSAHRFVRIYDTRASKEPIRSTQLGDYGYTSIVETENGKSLIIGDTIGTLTKLHSQSLQPIGVYKGPVGCTKAMESSSGLPYVATVGLDRMLRMYNVTTKQLVRQAYLKQRLTAVLFENTVHQSNASIVTRDEDMIPEGPIPGAGRKAQPEGFTSLLRDTDNPAIQPTDAEETQQVWDELNRRAELANEQNKETTVKKKKSTVKTRKIEEENDYGDDNTGKKNSKNPNANVMVSEKWGDGGDDYSDDDDDDDDDDDENDFDDDDEEEEDDDELDEELDDEDEFNDDFDDDDEEEDDEDVAALVDSKKTAKELLYQTKRAQGIKQNKGGKTSHTSVKDSKKRKYK